MSASEHPGPFEWLTEQVRDEDGHFHLPMTDDDNPEPFCDHDHEDWPCETARTLFARTRLIARACLHAAGDEASGGRSESFDQHEREWLVEEGLTMLAHCGDIHPTYIDDSEPAPDRMVEPGETT